MGLTVLVTGGSGFLGRHLVPHLTLRGHRVRHQDIVDAPWRDPAVPFIAGRFDDENALPAMLSGVDAIVHLASTTIPQTSNENPVGDARDNLIGTLKLIDAASKAGVRRIVVPSSGGTVYGDSPAALIGEDHPTDPKCAYGVVKLAIEKYLALYHALNGLQSVALRIANLYGEHQRPDTGLGAIAVFCHKALRGETVEIWGDGTQSRDFVYAGDVVRAVEAALDVPLQAPLVANIGSGTSTSLVEILAAIESITGRPVARTHTEGRAFDVRRTCLDIRRAAAILGWRPEVQLDDGIRRVLAAAR